MSGVYKKYCGTHGLTVRFRSICPSGLPLYQSGSSVLIHRVHESPVRLTQRVLEGFSKKQTGHCRILSRRTASEVCSFRRIRKASLDKNTFISCPLLYYSSRWLTGDGVYGDIIYCFPLVFVLFEGAKCLLSMVDDTWRLLNGR